MISEAHNVLCRVLPCPLPKKIIRSPYERICVSYSEKALEQKDTIDQY